MVKMKIRKSYYFNLTAEQLEAISGTMDIVGIELAEQKDPVFNSLPAHKAIIDVLESNFDDDDYVNLILMKMMNMKK